MDVYEACPFFQNERFLFRLVREEDWSDLLKVYSDEKAVPLFNSDNCHGDDFHYQTEARMRQAIRFWLDEYRNRMYVRFCIVDRRTGEGCGTAEVFVRRANDDYNDCIILRLDLRSDYEKEETLVELLDLLLPQLGLYWHCSRIATKAVPMASRRRCALAKLGFVPGRKKLIGHDGTEYGDYFVLNAGND